VRWRVGGRRGHITGVNLPADDQTCFSKASLDDAAELGFVRDYIFRAGLYGCSGGVVPGCWEGREGFEFVAYGRRLETMGYSGG